MPGRNYNPLAHYSENRAFRNTILDVQLTEEFDE